jgi:hypothetical protein
MTSPIHRGKVEKGKLILEDPSRYLLRIASLEGKRVELSLKKYRENRSDNQNRYYWAVVVELLANHCGYAPEEMHEALKIKFLSSQPRDEHGLVKIGSTARLNTDEFIQYTNKIVIWAATELQVFIPDPSQVEF